MNRTDRLLAIVLELQAKRWQRAEDLAATFEISKRTIYRDLQALAESGVPIVSVPGQGYSLVEGYFLPPLSFSTDEAITLLLGADFMAQHFDAQYRRAAHSSASKIEAVLTEKLREEVRYLQSSMKFVAAMPRTNAIQPEMLAQLRRAVIEHRTVRFEYHTRFADEAGGVKRTRDADPYALVNYNNRWYMVAHCHLRHDTRKFRLERISHLRLTDRLFTRPEDFQLELLPSEERPIVVRALFSREVAAWVREDRSFYTVREEEVEDGLLVALTVHQEGDVLQWLLGWGRQVQVLEPESLRMRLAEEVEAILEHYRLGELVQP